LPSSREKHARTSDSQKVLEAVGCRRAVVGDSRTNWVAVYGATDKREVKVSHESLAAAAPHKTFSTVSDPTANARHRTRTPMPPGRSPWAPVLQQGRPEQGDPSNSPPCTRRKRDEHLHHRLPFLFGLLMSHDPTMRSTCWSDTTTQAPVSTDRPRHRNHSDLARCLATAHPALTSSAGEGGQHDAGSGRNIAPPRRVLSPFDPSLDCLATGMTSSKGEAPLERGGQGDPVLVLANTVYLPLRIDESVNYANG
jgi:hypothetical protein